jgi:Protein of unknown function (DUF2892)
VTPNVGPFDRILRIVGGIALLAWAFLGTSDWHMLGWIGLVPLATAAIGWCPAYSIIGVNTCPAKRA